MVCLASYLHPVTGATVQTRATDSLSIGRQPAHPGLEIASGDLAVSRIAIDVRFVTDGMVITNTSRYAPLEVRAGDATFVLDPGDTTTTVVGPCELTLVGADGPHTVTLTPIVDETDRPEAAPTSSPVVGPNDVAETDDDTGPDTGPVPAAAEQDEMPIDRTLPLGAGGSPWGARLPALVALCASRLEPDDQRWTVSTIDGFAQLLVAAGHDVTPESVGADLLAVRDKLWNDTQIRFVSRNDLADHLVVNQLVTRDDLDRVMRSVDVEPPADGDVTPPNGIDTADVVNGVGPIDTADVVNGVGPIDTADVVNGVGPIDTADVVNIVGPVDTAATTGRIDTTTADHREAPPHAPVDASLAQLVSTVDQVLLDPTPLQMPSPSGDVIGSDDDDQRLG